MKSQGELSSLLLSVMAGLYSPAEHSCSCNGEQYGCISTFDHNVGCNGRLALSVFSFIDSMQKKKQINVKMERLLLISNALHTQTAPKIISVNPWVISYTPAKFEVNLMSGYVRDRQTEISWLHTKMELSVYLGRLQQQQPFLYSLYYDNLH